MKAIFAVLLSYVFFAAQCYAIKGGPVYPGGQIVTTGSYAGVLYPTGNDNSLGIFTVTVPSIGIANGTVALFRKGNFYPGTIQGIADPDSAQFVGVANASFNINFASVTTSGSSTSTTTFVVTFNANGNISANIVSNPDNFSSVSARLVGTASLTYNVVGAIDQNQISSGDSKGPIAYTVDGFKQAQTNG